MIIAIREKDRVVVAFSGLDSWCNVAEEDYVDEENIAIRFSKSGKIFGCGALNRVCDVVLYDEEILQANITPSTIVREVVPRIKDCLKENEVALDSEGRWKNALVICDNKNIYDIDPLFGFYQADDYVCHGYSVEILKSVLDATSTLPAEERIIKAVSFASLMSKESLFPFVITDTKNKKLKKIYKGENYSECIDSL